MKKLLGALFVLMSLTGFSQEIGLQLYSIRNEVKQDLKGTLQKIRSMGIRELEGGETYGMGVDAFTSMIHDMGFKMIGIGVDYDALTKDLGPVIEQAKKWVQHMSSVFGLATMEMNLEWVMLKKQQKDSTTLVKYSKQLDSNFVTIFMDMSFVPQKMVPCLMT